MTDVTSEPPAPTDDDLFDEEWLATDTKRHRARTVLIVLLLAACVFYAGTVVQKHYGTSSASGSAATPSPGAGGLPSLLEGASGGLPGGGTLPSGGAGPSSGGATSDADPSGSDAGASTASTPVVVGTLKKVAGDTWTVVDFGGRAHRVRVSDNTQVTRPLGDAADAIQVGADVSVEGTTADSGLVTATAVTFS